MKKIVLIDSQYPINTRNQKIVDSLRKVFPETEVHVIAWDRMNIGENGDVNLHLFKQYSEYGNLRKKLMYLWQFKKHIVDTLETISPDIIIASHWSTLILVPKLKKNQKLIYENLDVPTEAAPIRWTTKLFEKHALRQVSLIVHASRFFQQLYPTSIPQIVLENKPTFQKETRTTPFNEEKLIISFIGTVRYADMQYILMDAVRDDSRFELRFHGMGRDLELCQNYGKEISNVIFTGKYDYHTIAKLYHESDLVWAAYPNKDYNVKYAISNKFHESLWFGTPCVFSEKTELGDYVRGNNIGFIVDPYSVESIKTLLEDIYTKRYDMNKILVNMQTMSNKEGDWDSDFSKLAAWLDENK